MSRQPTGPERRRHSRVPASEAPTADGVPFRLVTGGRTETFDLVDLSESGVRIRCRHAMPAMTRIEVQMLLPGGRVGAASDVRFETTGVVVWSHKQAPDAYDTGVFFADLDDRQRNLLQTFVGSHS